MIGWRYHLVSIVAVFLALALGLLIGTAFLNDRLVDDLRARTEALQVDRDLQAATLRSLRQLAERAFPFLVDGHLQGVDVVIVTHAGADGESIARARDALERSGARVVTTVEIQPSLLAPNEEELGQLADVLGLPLETPGDDVVAAASRELGQRLAAGPAAGPAEDDLLTRLVLGEFLQATDPEIDTVRVVGGPDQIFVVVGGSGSETVPAPAAVVVVLAQVLTDEGVTVAVGENAATSSAALVAAVRERVTDGRGPVVTVDNLAEPFGGAALVLGLQQAREFGEGGDYGLAEDAELLPPAAT